jgi:hypothetical protein
VFAAFQPHWPLFQVFNVLALVFALKASDVSIQKRVMAYASAVVVFCSGFVIFKNNDADMPVDAGVCAVICALYVYAVLDGDVSLGHFKEVYLGGKGIKGAKQGSADTKYAAFFLAATYLFLGISAIVSPENFFKGWQIGTGGLDPTLLTAITRWYGVGVASIGAYGFAMATHGSPEALRDVIHHHLLMIVSLFAALPHIKRTIAAVAPGSGSDFADKFLMLMAARLAVALYAVYTLYRDGAVSGGKQTRGRTQSRSSTGGGAASPRRSPRRR